MIKIKNLSLIFLAIVFVLIGYFSLKYQKHVFIFANNDDNPISEERISFLVLGRTGKVIGWNFAPDLTDSVMLVDYRPQIGAINIISLPRDLYITLDNQSFKLNEVLKRNKLDALLDKLPDITGLKTDKYIVVDIDLLKSVVDDMGGIDMDLKSPAVDWASGYTIQAGKQHLDGNQAVFLARNRYAPEGDFFREKNQQDVIKAIFSKFKEMGPIDKVTYIFKVTPELNRLQTNINFQQMIPLIGKMNNLRFNNIVLDFKTGLVQSSSVQYGSSSAYILIPNKGQDNYLDIKNYIREKLEK